MQRWSEALLYDEAAQFHKTAIPHHFTTGKHILLVSSFVGSAGTRAGGLSCIRMPYDDQGETKDREGLLVVML